MSGEGSGHDWWHVYRVWQTAKRIAAHEFADGTLRRYRSRRTGRPAARPRRSQVSRRRHEVAPRMARDWLVSLQAEHELIDHVAEIVATLSFKGAGVATPMTTLEGKIVQDADRLDAIGAVGIARAFAYGGHKGRELYNPDIPPQLHDDFAQYSGSTAPTINHFYEKLLLLKDRMNTDVCQTGRRTAPSITWSSSSTSSSPSGTAMTLLVERATEDDLAAVIAVDAAHMGTADLDSCVQAISQKQLRARHCYIAREGWDVHRLRYPRPELLRAVFHRTGRRPPRSAPQRRSDSTDPSHRGDLPRREKLFTSTNESNAPMQALCDTTWLSSKSGWIDNLDDGDPEIIYFKRLPNP